MQFACLAAVHCDSCVCVFDAERGKRIKPEDSVLLTTDSSPTQMRNKSFSDHRTKKNEKLMICKRLNCSPQTINGLAFSPWGLQYYYLLYFTDSWANTSVSLHTTSTKVTRAISSEKSPKIGCYYVGMRQAGTGGCPHSCVSFKFRAFFFFFKQTCPSQTSILSNRCPHHKASPQRRLREDSATHRLKHLGQSRKRKSESVLLGSHMSWAHSLLSSNRFFILPVNWKLTFILCLNLATLALRGC